MRLPNKTLENKILEETLNLLLEKEPSEIGMRDVAKNCGISATSIYNYYKDKNELFMKISLSCLFELKEGMESAIKNTSSSTEKIRESLKFYRDWCFKKPKVAILLFSKLEESIAKEDIKNFYICNNLGEKILYECMEQGIYKGKNIKLDTGIIISGMWGCIESILTKRTDPLFWNENIKFTDRFIDIIISSLIEENK